MVGVGSKELSLLETPNHTLIARFILFKRGSSLYMKSYLDCVQIALVVQIIILLSRYEREMEVWRKTNPEPACGKKVPIKKPEPEPEPEQESSSDDDDDDDDSDEDSDDDDKSDSNDSDSD